MGYFDNTISDTGEVYPGMCGGRSSCIPAVTLCIYYDMHTYMRTGCQKRRKKKWLDMIISEHHLYWAITFGEEKNPFEKPIGIG